MTATRYLPTRSSYIIAVHQMEQCKLYPKIRHRLSRAHTRAFQERMKCRLHATILRLLQPAVGIVCKGIGIDVWIVMQCVEASANRHTPRHVNAVDGNAALHHLTGDAAGFGRGKAHGFINAGTEVAEGAERGVVDLFCWCDAGAYLFRSLVEDGGVLEPIEGCCGDDEAHGVATCGYQQRAVGSELILVIEVYAD